MTHRVRGLGMAGIVLVLALGAAPEAHATAQTPERISVNGRQGELRSLPLAPLIRGRGHLAALMPGPDSGHWRGYTGHWLVRGDRLLLVDLETGKHRDEVLRGLFGSTKLPRAATWFTGRLRVSAGPQMQLLSLAFGSASVVELWLEVRAGRVVSSRRVDMRQLRRSVSEADLARRALAYQKPRVNEGITEPGAWIDARTLDDSHHGRVVRTRGVVGWPEELSGRDGLKVLEVPKTPTTPRVEIVLDRTFPEYGGLSWRRVEVEGILQASPAGLRLRIIWVRALLGMESIHHPTFETPPLPPLPMDRLARESEEIKIDDSLILFPGLARVRDPDEWTYEWIGHSEFIEVMGPLQKEQTLGGRTIWTVLEIEVDPRGLEEGAEVRVVGSFVKTVMTKDLLTVDHPDVAPFRDHGPGTWYRLEDPRDGSLAKAWVPTK